MTHSDSYAQETNNCLGIECDLSAPGSGSPGQAVVSWHSANGGLGVDYSSRLGGAAGYEHAGEVNELEVVALLHKSTFA